VIDRIEDEPVRFFLRHRSQIEAWAALASETRQVAHQAMMAVGERLSENPPAGAEVLAGDDGGYDARLLYRPDWRGEGGNPMAAVGIGWHPMRVDFKPGLCWIGIWRGQQAEADPLATLLRASLAESAAALELKNKGWQQWPMYKSAPGPTGEFWDDLRPWVEDLAETLRTVWDRTADEIGGILRQHDSTLV
jgi:hypothetical protein